MALMSMIVSSSVSAESKSTGMLSVKSEIQKPVKKVVHKKKGKKHGAHHHVTKK